MRRTFNTLFILFIGGLNLAKAKEFNVDYGNVHSVYRGGKNNLEIYWVIFLLLL